jgi:hypothetical protein
MSSLRFRVGQREPVAYIDHVLCQTSSAEVIYYQLTDLLQLVSSPNFEERSVGVSDLIILYP